MLRVALGAIVQRQICAEALRQTVDRLLLFLPRRIQAGTNSATTSPATSNGCPKGGTPARKCQSKPAVRTTRTRLPNRQIYLEVEPLHPGLLSAFAMRAWLSVLGLGEHVTCAADCDDAPGFSWIIFDRGTDTGDMDINRAVESLDRLALDRIH